MKKKNITVSVILIQDASQYSIFGDNGNFCKTYGQLGDSCYVLEDCSGQLVCNTIVATDQKCNSLFFNSIQNWVKNKFVFIVHTCLKGVDHTCLKDDECANNLNCIDGICACSGVIIIFYSVLKLNIIYKIWFYSIKEFNLSSKCIRMCAVGSFRWPLPNDRTMCARLSLW